MHFTFLNADRHIPASFEVNGKQFDDAFPVPIAQILIDKEQMHILEIGANKLCIPFADIYAISFSAKKRLAGGWYEGFHVSFLLTLHLELKKGESYDFYNSSMALLYALYEAFEGSGVLLFDPVGLRSILADIDMEQDRHEREAQIVKALTPFSDRFSYLMGNRAK